MKVLIIVIFSAVYSGCWSQNVTMPTSGSSAVQRCGDRVFDSGGNGNDYQNNENGVLTICPSNPGTRVVLTFTAFELQNNDDFLRIYDGNSTASPQIALLTGNGNPGVIQASLANPTGCLTLRFTSDGSGRRDGFAANISCSCQNLTSVVTSVPAAVSGSVKTCPGTSVSFNGSGVFSSGTSAGASYIWNFGDGATASGLNATHSYAAPGNYLVNLQITDANGCQNANINAYHVQVAPPPTISVGALPSVLCTNTPSALTANVAMNPFIVNCTPPVSGQTFLPDGNGVSYTTGITVNCFDASSQISSPADFESICLNMEHSFLGDLNIRLTCPNGNSVNLKQYSGGGSANLGIPWATNTADNQFNNTTPGIGADYCFTPTATTIIENAVIAGGVFVSGNGPGVYIDGFVPAGSYASEQALTALNGCPLNGNWTITVTDHQERDNGYIFSWDIDFSSSFPVFGNFTPTIASQGWIPATTLTSTGLLTSTVLPANQGAPCFNYTMTNNYGCTYTVPQCLTVNCGFSLPIELVYFEANALSDNKVELKWATETEQNSSHFEIDRSADATTWELLTTVAAAGDSETEKNYRVVDNEPIHGISYYRLRSVDNDGTEKLSDVDVVTIDPESGILVIYPNPATDRLTIEGKDEDLESLVFINALGQDITAEIDLDSHDPLKLQADISALAKGTYMIKNAGRTYLVVKN